MRQRLSDDPHVWASALFDESSGVGLFAELSHVRAKDPPSGSSTVVWWVCGHQRSVPSAIIDHPPGEECQWDWVELGDTPWGI